MEIAILPQNSLKIKSKQASIVIDQQDKAEYDASLVLTKMPEELPFQANEVVIKAPGEYEVGGIKITGIRSEAEMVYTLNVDGVDVVVGKIETLNKMQNKLADNNIIVAFCESAENVSFLTSLATNVIALYGEKAEEVGQVFGQDKVKKVNKYNSTREKLPAEVETIVLS